MKKLSILFIFFCSCSKHSIGQVYSEMGTGYNTQGRIMAFWSVGYSKSIIEFQGEMRPSLSRSVYGSHYFGGRAGLRIVNSTESNIILSMGAGYFYNIRSTDHKELNGNYWGTYVRGLKMVNDRAGVIIDLLYLNTSLEATIGIHYIFN